MILEKCKNKYSSLATVSQKNELLEKIVCNFAMIKKIQKTQSITQRGAREDATLSRRLDAKIEKLLEKITFAKQIS